MQPRRLDFSTEKLEHLNAPSRPDLVPSPRPSGGWSPKAKRNAVLLAIGVVVAVIVAASAGEPDSSSVAEPSPPPFTYSPVPPPTRTGGGGGQAALTNVPAVYDLRLAAARQKLKKNELGVRVRKSASSQPAGTVLRQHPASGTQVRQNKTVIVIVAKPRPEPPSTNGGAGAGGGGSSCTAGYSPCLPPASDYDCSGGSGDGPEYTGTVRVTGSDPYGLDADHDGFGCE
jgi:hypothetical protein